MEQGIRCSNHPDRNAIRLCDGCSMPFCTDCLRKNLLGFYYCQRCYPRLIRGIIIGFCLLLFNFIIAMQFSNLPLDSGLKWNILNIIITYFLAALSCGKFWPENPKRWGFWLTVPYGFAVTSLIIIQLIMGGHDIALGLFLSMILMFVYFILVLISSTGAYVGSRMGKNV